VTTPLFTSSPAWTIAENTLVGFDLSFTQGIALVGIDAYAMADEALAEFSAQIASALSDVPDGFLLRFCSLELASYDASVKRYRARLNGSSCSAS
jgi:hypothetical protein